VEFLQSIGRGNAVKGRLFLEYGLDCRAHLDVAAGGPRARWATVHGGTPVGVTATLHYDQAAAVHR